jgi:hypothetical protein
MDFVLLDRVKTSGLDFKNGGGGANLLDSEPITSKLSVEVSWGKQQPCCSWETREKDHGKI